MTNLLISGKKKSAVTKNFVSQVVVGIMGLSLVLGGVGLTTSTVAEAQECTPPQLEIVSNTNLNAIVGEEFNYIVVTSAESDSYTLSSNLPAGLEFSSGMISGVPTTAGESSIVLSATNQCGTATDDLSITVHTVTAAETDDEVKCPGGAETDEDVRCPSEAETSVETPEAPTPTEAEESVSLDEVPETGFDADYILTLTFYILGLLGMSALVIARLTGGEETAYVTSSSDPEDFADWKRSHDDRMTDKPIRVDGIRRRS